MLEPATRILTAKEIINSVRYGVMSGFYIGITEAVVPITAKGLITLMLQAAEVGDSQHYFCHFNDFALYVELAGVDEEALCEK